MEAQSIPALVSDHRPSLFHRLSRRVLALAKRVPVTSDPLAAYGRIAGIYEGWADRATTPQAAEYWGRHSRAIRQMIDDQRATRDGRSN